MRYRTQLALPPATTRTARTFKFCQPSRPKFMYRLTWTTFGPSKANTWVKCRATEEVARRLFTTYTVST